MGTGLAASAASAAHPRRNQIWVPPPPPPPPGGKIPHPLIPVIASAWEVCRSVFIGPPCIDTFFETARMLSGHLDFYLPLSDFPAAHACLVSTLYKWLCFSSLSRVETRFNFHSSLYKWLCFSSLPRVETRFNFHYQNAYANAFLGLLRLSSISQYREYESRGRPCHCAAALRSLIRRHMPLRRLVGDIKAFQKNFAFIISTETCFWLKRVSDRTFFGRFRKAFLTP